uniref:Subtilisin-like protease SBT6.1 n=1 Tax=Cicer arietinum TaxID=3827 RepID=A0A3Q7XXG3_CICAR|nr:subtilisin-like protease SBT6.1 [Cicer arietinum]
MATTTQHRTTTIFSFFLLFISLFKTLTLNPPFSPQPQPQSPNYIIGFTQYKTADHHRAYLESNLQSKGWHWIVRKNPASKFPTDFGVVSVNELGVIEEIKKLGLVKYVSLDMSYKRGLMKHRNDKVGSFVDGNKRPGKIFTRMSFCDAEEQEDDFVKRNDSIKLGRELLIQRSQVTSMFGAEELWTRGYTGAKVKMAIFDTGIRADHPHFRNIKLMDRVLRNFTGAYKLDQ